MSKRRLLSLDIETTGLDPYDQILEIGAIVIDEAGNEAARFHCYIRYDKVSGNVVALHMNERIIRILAGVSVPDAPIYHEDAAAVHFHQFLEENVGDDGVYTVAGKNAAGFDIPMINRLFESTLPWIDNKKPRNFFHHRVLDLGSIFWNPARDGWKVPGTKEVLEGIGRTATNLHTAVGDAEDVIHALRERVTRN